MRPSNTNSTLTASRTKPDRAPVADGTLSADPAQRPPALRAYREPHVETYSARTRLVIWVVLAAASWAVVLGLGYGAYNVVQAAF